MVRIAHRPVLCPLCRHCRARRPGARRPSRNSPREEESADVTFAKSFLGKTYDDELDIEGWNDLGGGLVAPPIYVRQYQRERTAPTWC